MLALLTVSAIFLRWLPHHGLPILLLFAVATGAAAAIYFTQRRRYSASSHGIRQENVEADIPAVFWAAVAGVVLGGIGIGVVLG
jgi:uncharacterized membrane protein YfcA